MLLTITTTHSPATDLGYLLAKHPERCQSFPLSFGQAHVFYPEAQTKRCTVALLLDIDPVGLVRGFRGSNNGTLSQYVNDRPYVASSFLSVAIAKVFGSALNASCKDKPELVDVALPLRAEISVLPSRGGEKWLHQLFAPLGYHIEAQRLPLDEQFPEWGDSAYYRVTLTHTCRLHELLTHLYVLLPVLDNDKHYWVGQDELDKLLARGEGWLAAHPEREQIANRYLKHQKRLVREALLRLIAEDEPDPEASEAERGQMEIQLERPLSLNQRRIGTVIAVLKDIGARRVVDLGCGEGRLLQALLQEREFEHITGVDVSMRALEIAHARLHIERLPTKQRERIQLWQSALTYRDQRLTDYDAACAIEVIEHLDPPRLPAFERAVFACAQPRHVIVTTPNVEYNARFESLPAGSLRHRDHRFEWSRAEFQAWAENVGQRFDYQVRFLGIGDEDAELGTPTQMGVFSR